MPITTREFRARNGNGQFLAECIKSLGHIPSPLNAAIVTDPEKRLSVMIDVDAIKRDPDRPRDPSYLIEGRVNNDSLWEGKLENHQGSLAVHGRFVLGEDKVTLTYDPEVDANDS